jgi:hypothetical protein
LLIALVFIIAYIVPITIIVIYVFQDGTLPMEYAKQIMDAQYQIVLRVLHLQYVFLVLRTIKYPTIHVRQFAIYKVAQLAQL